MSGVVGFVFLLTLLNCVFGLIDITYQGLKRRRKP